MSRRHLKKDDRNLLCGLSMTPTFQRQLAPDRQSVTCGACELASRPQRKAVAKAAEIPAEWEAQAEAAEGEEAAAVAAPRARREAVPGAPTQMRPRQTPGAE